MGRAVRLRLFAAIVVIATAAWSFASLRDLAAQLGFGQLSWLFPLSVDAVAALGMDVWMSRSAAWRHGRNLAVGAVLVSVAGNVAHWMITLMDPRSAVLSSVPPLMLAATLLVLHRHQEPAPDDTPVPAPAPVLVPVAVAPSPEPELAPVALAPAKTNGHVVSVPKAAPRETGAKLGAGNAELLAVLMQYHQDHGELPTRRAAMTLLGVGTGRVTTLLRTAQDQVQAQRDRVPS